MKKEFGKWLMDIAKYLMTVAILSSIITDMDKTGSSDISRDSC